MSALTASRFSVLLSPQLSTNKKLSTTSAANVVNAASALSNVTKVNPLAQAAAAKNINASSAVTNADGAISGSRWLSDGMNRIIAGAESDPQLAKKVAEDFAHIPDRMTLDWADAPSPRDADAFNAWVNQSVEFDKVAAPITEQRINLFNAMKAQGASDVDILKAVVDFNSKQPAAYQIKTGFLKVNTFA